MNTSPGATIDATVSEHAVKRRRPQHQASTTVCLEIFTSSFTRAGESNGTFYNIAFHDSDTDYLHTLRLREPQINDLITLLITSRKPSYLANRYSQFLDKFKPRFSYIRGSSQDYEEFSFWPDNQLSANELLIKMLASEGIKNALR
jgi:hypothetical protein